MKENQQKSITEFFNNHPNTEKTKNKKNKEEIPEIKIKKIESPKNIEFPKNIKFRRSKSDDYKHQIKCSRVKTKNKSENFSANEEKTQNNDEIKYQDQQIMKSLKEINENPLVQTSGKQNTSSNFLNSSDSNQEKNFKRASKTKTTLKVVMENYKRSPSILFSSPLQNVYLKDVLNIFFINC